MHLKNDGNSMLVGGKSGFLFVVVVWVKVEARTAVNRESLESRAFRDSTILYVSLFICTIKLI